MFQAHALAVQTGCEVLFKVHDNQDITGCQYYATTNLKRIYRNSKLQQAGETQVSGETGLPLMDKCIQYGEDASASTESSIPTDDGGGGDGDNMQGAFPGQVMGANQGGAVPMQLSSSAGFSDFNSQTQQTQGDGDNDSDVEITQITNPQHILTAAAQVKQEPGTMFQQPNTMYGQQQQQQGMLGNEGVMGSQGMMGANQGMVQPGYQVPIAPKPYQCSICRKAFKSVHVLQKHTLTFHTPGGAGVRSRGRGSRGSRGGRGRGSRGRGLKLTISRTQIGGHQQQYQAMPTVKTEAGASASSEQNG